ncbi:hypothetical protein [Nocardioides sp. Kera G14]|uniref:hypothetical protein n=1 Tax=Nocardioides sp. Kera G14 TaxID=2884264 RepID=UPI001D0F612E|nr:hypothetical protein [Nocardioides sp. Kera G14]UDY23423.1 hypothetical protein LH076_15380 [Nocardioides sp. Kera G14]
MTTNPTATERAQEAASTASDEGRHLTGVAQEEAANVASEAANQARHVMDEAVTQLNAQTNEQKDRLADTLRSVGDDLGSMASQASPGLAADLSRQASDYARTISNHLQSREPGELLDDVRQFARKRPGTFLFGALAAGVVVGRLVRGTADGIAGAKYVQQQQPPSTPPPSPAAPALPVADPVGEATQQIQPVQPVDTVLRPQEPAGVNPVTGYPAGHVTGDSTGALDR